MMEKRKCAFFKFQEKKKNYELPEHFLSNNIIKCTKISILMPVGFLVKYVALQSKQHLTAIEVYSVDQATKLFWKTELSRVGFFFCVRVQHLEKKISTTASSRRLNLTEDLQSKREIQR